MKVKFPLRPDLKGRTVILPQRIGYCFYCGKDLSFDMRRISFCCNEHMEAYYKLFVYEKSTKHQIFVKDNYKCVQCGFNEKDFLKEVNEQFPVTWPLRGRTGNWKGRQKYIESKGFSTNQAYLEIDHIRPVKMGGDPLDIANQQTLCYPCHKKKTKKDVGQMAAMRAICKEIKGLKIKKKRVTRLLRFFDE